MNRRNNTAHHLDPAERTASRAGAAALLALGLAAMAAIGAIGAAPTAAHGQAAAGAPAASVAASTALVALLDVLATGDQAPRAARVVANATRTLITRQTIHGAVPPDQGCVPPEAAD